VQPYLKYVASRSSRSNTHRFGRHLAPGALCIMIVALPAVSARSNDTDGLRVERDFKRKQCDCAFRWRDHLRNASVNMVGCIGFDGQMPDAAKAAMAAGAYLY